MRSVRPRSLRSRILPTPRTKFQLRALFQPWSRHGVTNCHWRPASRPDFAGGTSMAHVHALMGADAIRTRPIVRTIGIADLGDALRRGVADFSAMPTHAVFLCLIYPIIGVILARLTLGYALLPLLFPLAAGFALVGPFVAIGFYELSRRREQGGD